MVRTIIPLYPEAKDAEIQALLKDKTLANVLRELENGSSSVRRKL